MSQTKKPLSLEELAILSKGESRGQYLDALTVELKPLKEAISRSWENRTGVDRTEFDWAMSGPKVMEIVDKYRGGCFKSYTRKAFKNACMDHVKFERKMNHTYLDNPLPYKDPDDLEGNYYSIIPAPDNVEAEIMAKEIKKVLAVFAETYENDAIILQLVIKGRTRKEICHQIDGTNAYTKKDDIRIRKRVSRARDRFQNFLVKSGMYSHDYLDTFRNKKAA